MRQRTLKPGFFTNEDLCALPHSTRLLFQGLWLIADRAGRFEDRPARIKATVFPYEPELDMESMLRALELNGFIRRYTAGAERYGCVTKFTKNQNPHPKETPSVIPAPVELHGKQHASNVKDVPSNAGSSGSSIPSGSSGSSKEVAPTVPALDGKLLDEIACPSCLKVGYLTQSTGRNGNPPGFWCRNTGGCGQNFPIDFEEIVSLMTPGARRAVAAVAPKESKSKAQTTEEAILEGMRRVQERGVILSGGNK